MPDCLHILRANTCSFAPNRSVEKLTDMAVEQGGAVPAAVSKGPGSGGLGMVPGWLNGRCQPGKS